MFAYAFEARAIQSWILGGGRSADMVAASDLVDQLTGKVIDNALDTLGLTEGKELQIARRAGGAFYAVFTDECHASALRDLMALVVSAFTPGLEFIHAISGGSSAQTALSNALASMFPMRNQPVPALPVAVPLVEREARTGFPAVASIASGAERKRGPASASTLAKRSGSLTQEQLSSRFMADADDQLAIWVWPRNMDASESDAEMDDPQTFPFVGGERQVAIIHADGNGLGQVLLKLSEAVGQAAHVDYVALFRDFSNRVEQATRHAAQRATAKVLMPAAQEIKKQSEKPRRKLPARPLVLGGDDLSIIVRSDLAFPFVTEFIRQFGLATAEELSAWHKDPRWKSVFETPAGKELAGMKQLSACAGIAFVKANQPFEMGYHLAETLCQAAKQASGLNPKINGLRDASLAFYRLTTALAEDPDELAGSCILDGQEIPLRLGAYSLDEGNGLASVFALSSLATVLEQYPAISAGGLRQLLTVMQEDVAEARTLYARWRQVLQGRDAGALTAFDRALANLGIPAPETGLPLVRTGSAENVQLACPLEDLFDWRAVQATVQTQEASA